MTDTKKFFDLLFQYTEGQLVGWTSSDDKSMWISGDDKVDRLVSWIEDKGSRVDAYFSCLTRRPDLPQNPKLRGEAKHTYELCGVWADIDYKHPVHQKSDRLPTKEQAWEFIQSLPLKPTAIVFSGHGYQVWWMFKEPYMIENNEERRYAESVTFGWQAQLRRLIGQDKWVIDSVADLARIMRAPGSFNFKSVNKLGEANPKAVEIISLDESMVYDISEFEPYLAEDAHDLPVQVAHIDFDPDSTIPLDKFEFLENYDPEFRKAWNKQGKPPNDPSQSGWDMRIAIIAADGGFSDQEVVNLLVNYRRKYGEDLKHPGYYRLTVSKARVHTAAKERDAAAEDAMVGLRASEMGEGSTDIEKRRENLSKFLGIEIARLIKYTSTPAEYRLVLVDGRSVRIGSSRQLIRAAEFQVIMAELAGVYIQFERKEWPSVATNLLAIAEEESAGEEAVDMTQTKILIANYLSKNKLADGIEEAFPEKMNDTPRPFFDGEGNICIYGTQFRSWTETDSKIKISPKEMGVRFKEIGGENYTMNIRNTSRSIWKFSPDVLSQYIRLTGGQVEQINLDNLTD